MEREQGLVCVVMVYAVWYILNIGYSTRGLPFFVKVL
jgi:hypothetical protein